MSRFDETVAKIAASPVKRALFPKLAHLLHKESNFMEHLFGGADVAGRTGPQDMARMIAGTVGGAAGIGGGSYLVGKALDKYDDSHGLHEAERTQMGKMQGEQAFRQNALHKFAPLHKQVFTSVMQDPVIAKADPELIHSSYETMKHFAPHLATDANAARSFLRENAIYGTGPSYASLKNLADAELAVGKAGGTLGGT